MRITEVLKAILNTFIRKKAIIEPEGNTEVTEEPEAPEEPEIVAEITKSKEPDDLERRIRRYRAFAYHHRKKRIRKKYMKKLSDISMAGRLIFKVDQRCIVFSTTQMNGRWSGVDYSPRRHITPGNIGGRKMDHGDSRMNGGIR